MTNLISKLAIQTDAWCDQHYHNNPNYVLRWEEKFAELIIRECAAVSRKNSHRDDDMGSIIAQNIEKHFGINDL